MARTFAIAFLAAAALTTAAPTPVKAQTPTEPPGSTPTSTPAPTPASTEEAKAAARDLANKGLELYQAGNYKEAIQFFRDAEARFHAPTLLLIQANAHEKIGNLIEARGIYMQITRETLAPNASKEFKKAHADAEDLLGKIKGRIPKLKIVLKGGTPDKVQISIDNIPVPSSILERPLEQNPGVRRVVAEIQTKEGGRSVFQTVKLREGRIKQIQIVLRPGGGAVMSAPPGEERDEDEESGGSWVPAGIAFGVGAAGVGLGVVTGVLWLNEKDLIKETCPMGNACDPKVQPNIDKASTLGTLAIVGFATGGAGLALGTILALTRKGPAEPDPIEPGVTSVAVGPGSLMIRGAF